MMKRIFVSLACCALIAPLALAKDPSGQKSKRVRAWHFAFVSERPVTVTAPSATARVAGGAAADYHPANTLVVQQDGAGRYVLDANGHLFNSKGEAIGTAVRAGTPVRVYFGTDDAGRQTIDHVVVD
jgi:hypothetical protein